MSFWLLSNEGRDETEWWLKFSFVFVQDCDLVGFVCLEQRGETNVMGNNDIPLPICRNDWSLSK